MVCNFISLQGQRPKKISDIKISPYWNIQEANMILYKIEVL